MHTLHSVVINKVAISDSGKMSRCEDILFFSQFLAAVRLPTSQNVAAARKAWNLGSPHLFCGCVACRRTLNQGPLSAKCLRPSGEQ